MLVIAVDESTKKSHIRARRTLGSVLFRNGTRTYSGHLSEEALRTLITDLRSKATKNTSIAIFKAGAARGLELLTTIGSAALYSPEGILAIRSRTAQVIDDTPMASLAPGQRILRLVVRLAALLHDLGKLNRQFQLKLRVATPRERFRHETLSYLMLRHWAPSPATALATLAEDPAALAKCFGNNAEGAVVLALPSEVWAAARSGTEAQLLAAELDQLTWAPLREETSIEARLWSSVLWLVLTHHDLLGSNPALPSQPTWDRHVIASAPFETDNLTPFDPSSAPWVDRSWNARVKACSAQLLSAIQEHPAEAATLLSGNDWATNLALVARPYLIMSDYVGSILKQPTVKAKPSKRTAAVQSQAFANTIDQNKLPWLADTLTTHLVKVRSAVDPLFSLCEAHKGRSLPAIKIDQLPPDSLLRTYVPEDSRFHWQQAVADALRAVPDIEHRPLFAAVLSGTGAGKTAAAPKLLAAAGGGKLRFTCALGLRSLTLQTGAAYTLGGGRGLGLAPEDVLTVVGDALYAELQQGTSSEHLNALQDGSESLASEGEDALLFDEETSSGRATIARALSLGKRSAQQLLGSPRRLTMAESPALVCTVDHLMSAAAATRGGHFRMILRLATADLILDEVDNYSNEDLVCLGRLLELVGAYGRRVVLMSATMSETTISALATAWRKGLSAYYARTGHSHAPMLAIVSDQVPCSLTELPSNTPHASKVTEFISAHLAALAHRDNGNKADTLDLSDLISTPGQLAYESGLGRIAQRALALGAQFNTQLSTGKLLSTGMIRFSTVRHAREMAKHLHAMSLPEGTSLRVVCYHRRMPLHLLIEREKALNTLLARHEPAALERHPLIQAWLAAEPEATRYVLVVCGTSIQETGRDFDHDWAVLEPWSTRSAIQAAGRVQRHRCHRPMSPNVCLLTHPLDALHSTNSVSLELTKASNGPRQAIPLPTLARDASSVTALLRALAPQQSEMALLGGSSGPQTPSPLSRALAQVGVRPELAATHLQGKSLASATSFDLQGWAHRLDATHCLRAPSLATAPLTALEHAACAAYMGLEDNVPSTMSLRSILRTARGKLYASHHSSFVFRRETTPHQTLTFLAEDYTQPALVQQGREGLQALPLSPLTVTRPRLAHPERALVSASSLGAHRERARSEQILLGAFEIAAPRGALVGGTRPVIEFHELLGADILRG